MSEVSKGRGEATREAILAAAEEVFAEHGFAGARVDTIASVSGYNKNLLFRYFGDKSGLYTQVLRRADREVGVLLAEVFAPMLEEEVATPQRFRAFLEMMAQSIFDYLLEHPRLVRMLTWEMAEGWQTFKQIASQFPPETSEQFEAIFRKARSAGLLRSSFAPMIQLSMALQICLSYIAFMPLYQTLLMQDAPGIVEGQARSYIVDLIVGGMMIG